MISYEGPQHPPPPADTRRPWFGTPSALRISLILSAAASEMVIMNSPYRMKLLLFSKEIHHRVNERWDGIFLWHDVCPHAILFRGLRRDRPDAGHDNAVE